MRKTILALLALLILALSACGQKNSAAFEDIPEEITEIYETYMEALKTGTKEAVQYMHFENDRRIAYVDSTGKLVDYKIENIEKINDNLYAFTVSVKTTIEKDYHTSYNFVGRIDGELYVMNGVRQIPESISDNLDPNKYTYDDENIIG